MSRRPAPTWADRAGSPAARLKRRVGTLIGRPRRDHFLERLPRGAVGAEIGVFRGESPAGS